MLPRPGGSTAGERPLGSPLSVSGCPPRAHSEHVWGSRAPASCRFRRPMQTLAGRIILLGLLFALAACAATSSAPASSGVQYGIQDDTWLEFGPGKLDQRMTTFKRLGVPLVRFTLRWNEIALRRPKNAASPADRAYDWHRPDRILLGLRRHGLTPVLTVVGTPPWANGGRAPNFAPPHPRDFSRFATAAARRYPWVRYWLIWNEPNKRLWLRPTKPRIYVEHLLNPGYEAIHAVLPHARVGGGVTGPARRKRRRLTRRLDSRHGARPCEVRRLRAPPVPRVAVRDAVQRRLQELPVDHDGDDQEAPHPRQAPLRVEADLADGVRLPDEPARHVPRRAPQAAGDDAQPRGDARVEAATRDDVLPVPLSRRARAQPVPERPRVRGRSLEAVAAGIQAAVRADGARGRPGDRLGADPRRSARAKDLPAGGASEERVEADPAGAADERRRCLHPEDPPQARRPAPGLVARASGGSACSCGSGRPAVRLAVVPT